MTTTTSTPPSPSRITAVAWLFVGLLTAAHSFRPDCAFTSRASLQRRVRCPTCIVPAESSVVLTASDGDGDASPLDILPPMRRQSAYQERPGEKRGPRNNNNYNYNDRNRSFDGRSANNRDQGRGQRGGNNNQNNMNQFSDLNYEIVRQDTAQDLLSLLASKRGVLSSRAAGGALSSVNFSTSLHRLAKHMSNYNTRELPGNGRGQVLSDPRFALFMCGIAEALVDGPNDNQKAMLRGGKLWFGARELSNVVWALAKLGMVPPDSVMPVNIEDAEERLNAKASEVRSIIVGIAQRKAAGGGDSSSSSSSWIPALSELCGILMDAVSSKALELYAKEFKQQELSNIIWALTAAERPSEDVVTFVVNSILLSARNPENKHAKIVPQEWSIPLWCLAKTGFTSGHDEEILPFVNNMMDNEPGFLERFKPQELSNSVWAAAKILSQREEEAKGAASDAALGICRHAARELIRRGSDSYKSQELSNTAWAMATLGFGEKSDVSSAHSQFRHQYICLPSDDSEGDRALMQESISIVLQKMKENLRPFSMQELNNMCWAQARLNQRDDELLEMIGEQLANPRRKATPQDLSTSLWSMATMGYADKDVYRSVVARLADIGAEKFKPQELSNTIWALTTADVIPKHPHFFDDRLLPDNLRPSMEEAMSDPITACFALGASELIRRPDDFKPQEIKDILWSFAKVGVRHPVLFKTIAEHLVGNGDDPNIGGRGMTSFNTQGTANIAYAFAKHSQLGSEVLDLYGKQCRLPAAGGRLGCYMVAFLDVGEGLLRKLFAEIVRVDLELHEDLKKLSPQDISNTVWSCATLGLKHSKFLETVDETLQHRMRKYLSGDKHPMNRIKGQEISNSLLAMASLNYTPRGLLSTVEAYLMSIMEYEDEWTVPTIASFFTRQELANLAWAVAVFGEYPRHLIEIIYMGLTGIGDRPEPSYVQQAFGDTGTQQSHIISLLYLQIMMDLELGRDTNAFRPPEDFPSAWTSKSAFTSRTPDGNSMIDKELLELNTSNTQKFVSKAFSRVGFDNVEEFVHTMQDLAVDYGIQMTPYPTELLSIDFANADSKIGVEYDGPAHFITKIDGKDRTSASSVGNFDVKYGKLGYEFKWNACDQEINGSTALKKRLLKQLGWRIINIPFWDWSVVNSDAAAEDELCRALLDGVE